MCFIFFRITKGATIITRDNNVSYFTIKREGGKKCSFNREHKRYINNMYSSLLLSIVDLRSRILEVRDLLKTSHPLLSQKLEEPLDSKQEGIGIYVLYITLSTPAHSLSLDILDTEAYELVKTLEDFTSTVQEREGII